MVLACALPPTKISCELHPGVLKGSGVVEACIATHPNIKIPPYAHSTHKKILRSEYGVKRLPFGIASPNQYETGLLEKLCY